MLDITQVTCKCISELEKALNDAGFIVVDKKHPNFMTNNPDDPSIVDLPWQTGGVDSRDWYQSGNIRIQYTKCTKPYEVSMRYSFGAEPYYMIFSYIKLANDGIMCTLSYTGQGLSGSKRALYCEWAFVGPSGDSDWICLRTQANNYWWEGNGNGYIYGNYTTAEMRDAIMDKMDVSTYENYRNAILVKVDQDQGFMRFNPDFIPMTTPNSIHLCEYYMRENRILLDNLFACRKVPNYILTNRVFTNVHNTSPSNERYSVPDFYDEETYEIPAIFYNDVHCQHWADVTQYSSGWFGERIKVADQLFVVVPSFYMYYNGTIDGDGEQYYTKGNTTNYACMALRLA